MLKHMHMLGALELGSAWMLGWLAAAAIPLALHLLHRRRQQEIAWAAMELLLQAIRQNSRTVRIEQWLLLLLRTCTLILFAIALARPLLRGAADGETVVAQPPKLWIMVLDASYSMGYVPDRESLWEIAQRRAARLVSSAQEGDAFIVIEMAEPSTAIIAQPSFESDRVIEEINRLKCTDAGGDLAGALELVRQSIEDAQQSAPRSQDVHIVFFSDLGHDTWQSAVNGPQRQTIQEISSRHSVRIDSLAPEAPANIALTGFETDTPLLLRGRSLRAVATVQNFSGTDVQRLPVQFQSEGKTLHTEFVDCPAGASRSVVADMQPRATRYWNVSAAIPPDRLSIDNRRDLIVAVRPQVRVVTVEHTPGSAHLINLSLAPQSVDAGTNAPIAVETWNSIELASRSLSEIDAVILIDVNDLAASTIAKVTRFVENGGTVLSMLGPAMQPDYWNERADSAAQLFGFELRKPSESGDWRVDPLGYESPIAKPFMNFQDAGLLTTPVFRYWQITAKPDAKLIVDLGFTNGDPWLLRRNVGSGWAAALLSAPQSGTATTVNASEMDADEVWNAIATWPSFVPIMQKIVETIIGGSEQAASLSVGEPLRGALPRIARSTELSIQRPDGSLNRLTVPPAATGNNQPWIYAATDRAGVYRVSVDSQADDSAADQPSTFNRPYAVNIVPSQSDLQSISIAAVPLSQNDTSSQARSVVVRTSDEAQPSEWISRLCLQALLVVLVCESLLAWNLGRRLT